MLLHTQTSICLLHNHCRALKREANKRRFYSTLVYVYLSVTLGKDRHIHTVMLGIDCHIHIRIYACTHGHSIALKMMPEETALERWRRMARERVLQVG